jgi:hypothetical protein
MRSIRLPEQVHQAIQMNEQLRSGSVFQLELGDSSQYCADSERIAEAETGDDKILVTMKI